MTSRSSPPRSRCSPNRRWRWSTRSWTAAGRGRWREAYLEFLVLPGRPGDRGEALLPAPLRGRPCTLREAVSGAPPLHRRQGVRWMGEGTEDALRRWRCVRSDLSAWDVGATRRSTMTKARRNALPGFGPTLGLTVLYLSLLVLIPLCGVFVKTATLTPGQFWDIVTTPRALASYRLTIGASAVGRVVERRVRGARRMGAGPISVARTPVDRCARRSALCAADGGGRHCADVRVLEERLGGPAARAARDSRRLHSARHRRRADVHRPAVRGANGSAGAPGSEPRDRGGGRQPRGDARPGVPPRDSPDHRAGDPHGLHARVRARPRASTDPSSSSPGTCRCGRRSRRC